MEFLNEIRNHAFEGYDKRAIGSTRENIKKLIDDSDIVWNQWIENGLAINEKFVIDFNFYSSDNEGVQIFTKILRKNNFGVEVKTKRMLIFF